MALNKQFFNKMPLLFGNQEFGNQEFNEASQDDRIEPYKMT